ncbi:MAG: ammonium transporter, partial [bacterium]
LVMFMQAGFAMLETGFCRAKNASHTFLMNFCVYFIGILGFWATGFALEMGGAALGPVADLGLRIAGHRFGLAGLQGFFLGSDVATAGVFALFVHHMVFLDTAMTIPTGAMAERWKTINFLFYCAVMSMFIYPLVGHWVWGGGWLARLGGDFGLGHGCLDFAGSGVVHLVGGSAALAGASVLGPRIGKYDSNGLAAPIPGHHVPMAIIGIFILGFGWFGFNTSGALSGTDSRVALVAVNTMLASAAGATAAMFYIYFKIAKFEPSMTANGFLAGLVSVTASCAFVQPWAAVLIGAVGGLLACLANSVLEHVLRVDDPVGAISVHGACGAWGLLSVGLFADGSYGAGLNSVAGGVRGLFYGDPGQLGAQVIGLLVCSAWAFGTCWIFFKVCDGLWGIRVRPEVELQGLDIEECGSSAYPDFSVRNSRPRETHWTLQR